MLYQRVLVGSTVFYLLLPNLLFLGAWFKPIIGFILIILLLFSWFSIFKRDRKSSLQFELSKEDPPSLFQHIYLIVLATIICLFSGIGGFVFQGDFEKHYAMLHDLVYLDWPVTYNTSEVQFHLNYYFAYFLPPAALAKIFGLDTVDNWIIVWSALGLYLSFLWFIKLSNAKSIIWAICFLLFLGGQDFLYAWLKLQANSLLGDETIAQQIFEQEINTVCVFHNTILRYPTNFFAISWAPQHLIGGWLVCSLMVNDYQKKANQNFTIFYASLLPLWSIFNAIGLLPFLLARLFQNTKALFSWQNGVGLLTLLFIALFFKAHQTVSDKGPIWEYINLSQLLYKWPLFILFEFGYVVFLIYYFDKLNKIKILFFISISFLVILPIYLVGNMNDLLMRAAVPSLFLINLVAFRCFINIGHKAKYLVVVMIFLGVLLPQIITISSHLPKVLTYHLEHGFQESRNKIIDSKSLIDLTEENWFNSQYFGNGDSFYFRYLSPQND